MISTSWDRFRARNAAAQAVLDSVAGPNVRRSRPELLLCNTAVAGRCLIQKDGILFYYDDDHVSSAGARLIVADVLGQLDR